MWQTTELRKPLLPVRVAEIARRPDRSANYGNATQAGDGLVACAGGDDVVDGVGFGGYLFGADAVC